MLMLKSIEIVLFLGFLQGVQSDHKINVEVLFESLCPDSLNFIRKQLYPNWKTLSLHVDLKLIPFGKSESYQNGTKFVCQHGPSECRGNRLMSCALEMLENQDQKVEFVNCFMENYIKHREEELEIGEHCAEGLSVDKNSVLDCYNSELGTIIQLEAEQATARIRPKFVPTILFDGQFDQQLQDDSITNFKEVVCKLQSKIPEGTCKI